MIGLLCLNSTNKVVYAAHLLSFYDTEILVHARQRAPTQSTSNKNPGCWVSQGLPWAETSYMWQFCTLFPSHKKGSHKEVCVWILPDSACVFSPDDPAVHPYQIAVTNLSCEHKYVLSPLSPSSEPMNVRSWGLWHNWLNHSALISVHLFLQQIFTEPLHMPGTIPSTWDMLTEEEKL